MALSADPHLGRTSAERYGRILVPSILGPFAKALVDWAALRPGDWILDVGCGTGSAARAAAQQIGTFGRVVGLDLDTAMLDIARNLPIEGDKSVEWQEGDIYKMALPSKVFDIVFAAQTLQYLGNREAALAEIRRVLRPGGRFIMSAWSPPSDSPFFKAVTNAVHAHLDSEFSELLKPAFMLADRGEIDRMLINAGFRNTVITLNRLDQTFPNLDQFIPDYLNASPVEVGFHAASPETQQALVAQIKQQLAAPLESGNGWLSFHSYFAQAYN